MTLCCKIVYSRCSDFSQNKSKKIDALKDAWNKAYKGFILLANS